jgi:hypothetical protein
LVFTEASGTKQANQSPSAEQGFRYPAPNDQPKDVHVPSSNNKEDVYNTQYYTRDIRRMPQGYEVGMHPSLGYTPPVSLPKDAPKGSPGNKVSCEVILLFSICSVSLKIYLNIRTQLS